VTHFFFFFSLFFLFQWNKGSVVIMADTSGRINIPDGTVLENKILSGTLQIDEH
jgi:hypothetical protein